MYIRQNEFQNNVIKRDKVRHYIILKGVIHREDITIVIIDAPKTGASKYITTILEDFKKHINSKALTAGDFNTSLTKMGRPSKQRINNNIVALNNTLDKMDLIDIYRNFHHKEAKYTFFFKCTWNIFKDRPHGRTQNKPQQNQEN